MGWMRCVSKSTGKAYYFNPDSRESLWHDDVLPEGWAWGKTTEAGPRFYVHMPSGVRQDAPPPQKSAPPVVSLAPAAAAAAPPASDELNSVAYIPDPAVRGANVPAAIRSKRDYLFSNIPVDQRWNVQVDDVALYSVTEARSAAAMTNVLRDFVGPAATITDATACVGGNVLSFATVFPAVHAVELSASRAAMLAHNVSLLGPTLAPRVTVHQADYRSLMCQLKQDVVFFDPPWGGTNYKEAASLDMFLGSTDVGDIAVALSCARPPVDAIGAGVAVGAPFARFVAIKAPVNYNVTRLENKLREGGTGARIVLREALPKMLLLVIEQANPRSPPLSPALAKLIGGVPSAGAAGGTAAASANGREGGDQLGGSGPPAAKRSRLGDQGGSANVGGGTGDASRGPGDLLVSLQLIVGDDASGRGSSSGSAAPVSAYLSMDPQTSRLAVVEQQREAASLPSFIARRAEAAENTAAFTLEVSAVPAAAHSATPVGSSHRHGHMQPMQRDGSSSGSRRGFALPVVCSSDTGASSAFAWTLARQLLNPLNPDHSRECCDAISPAGCVLRQASSLPRGGLVLVRKSAAPVAAQPQNPHQGSPSWEVGFMPPHGEDDNAAVEDGWAPCLLRPVFHNSGTALCSVFAVPAAAAGVAGPVAEPDAATVRLLSAFIGMPSLTPCTPAAAAAATTAADPAPQPTQRSFASGVRGKVFFSQISHSCGGGRSETHAIAVKVQKWDARVAEENAIIDLLSLPSTAPSSSMQSTTTAAVSGAAGQRLSGPPAVLLPFAVVRDVGSGLCFHAMPDGGASLSELITQWGPVPSHLVLRALHRMGEALALCHASGVIYFDAQPENFVVGPAVAVTAAGLAAANAVSSASASPSPWTTAVDLRSLRLIDWGSARRATQTQTHHPLADAAAAPSPRWSYTGPTRGGRWDFMAPEQFGDGQYGSGVVTLTPASDVFALGALGAYMLCGEAPFGVPRGAKLTLDAARRHARRGDARLLEQWLRAGALATCDRRRAAAGAHDAATGACAECTRLVEILVRVMQPLPRERRVADAGGLLRALAAT